MEKFRFISAAASALALGGVLTIGTAQAGVPGGADAIRAAADIGAVTEQVQFRSGGYDYCWYDDGWRGPGWYWCGYAYRSGFGWGGPVGWNNWRWRDHDEFREHREFRDRDEFRGHREFRDHDDRFRDRDDRFRDRDHDRR
jgi:hypothetical protein